ncbi:hypothetical protein [Microvirga calopogonii]|uniref:hypothetical protein n=1 Tax=Microvirga calopogonii TaxID=2078013 RepID=UPI0013B370CE|nr:hypothetical protein [Microvirga calopogonii]
MRFEGREQDELQWRLEETNAQLARHKRMSRLALLLVALLNVMILAAVVHQLLTFEAP